MLRTRAVRIGLLAGLLGGAWARLEAQQLITEGSTYPLWYRGTTDPAVLIVPSQQERRLFSASLASELGRSTEPGAGMALARVQAGAPMLSALNDDALRLLTLSALQTEHTGRQAGAGRATAAAPAIAAALTPVVAIGALVGLQGVVDQLLDHATAMISSQLFALRSHLAATISDANVVFRDRMNETFDRLNEQQQKALLGVQALASQTETALQKLERDGFQSASDLLCQATVDQANYPLKLIDLHLFGTRQPAPDIVCLAHPEIHDAGGQHEQLIEFRGVRLLPKGEYPNALLTIPGKPDVSLPLPTAGGNTVIQLPLPGGLNGTFDDASPRGTLIALASFSWPGQSRGRRWFLEIQPFLVRTIDVVLTPQVDVVTYSTKTFDCYVRSGGGGLFSGGEQRNTCTLTVDPTGTAIACEIDHETTHNGDAGIANGPLLGPGSCEVGVRAKSGGLFSGSAWHGVLLRMTQKIVIRTAGPQYHTTWLMNQGTGSATVTYPLALPPGASLVPGSFQFAVTITTNAGDQFVLTDTQGSDPRIGSATIVGNTLTVQINDPGARFR